MAHELTPLAVAALALLREHPMHPYEMFQLMIKRHDDRLLKVRPGSLYHTVDRLARQGLVEATGTEREGNRPERTTYRATDAGLTALEDAVIDLIGTRAEEYLQFPLGLSEAHNIPPEVVAEMLERRQHESRAAADTLRLGITTMIDRDLPEAYRIDVDYALTMAEAEIAWVDALILRLRDGSLTWPAFTPDWNPLEPKDSK
jgi:DNA-binding PadR family transcriptional regulator